MKYDNINAIVYIEFSRSSTRLRVHSHFHLYSSQQTSGTVKTVP